MKVFLEPNRLTKDIFTKCREKQTKNKRMGPHKWNQLTLTLSIGVLNKLCVDNMNQCDQPNTILR